MNWAFPECHYRCTDYDDQVKAVLNEASASAAARAPGVDKPAIVIDKRNRHVDGVTGSWARKQPQFGRHSSMLHLKIGASIDQSGMIAHRGRPIFRKMPEPNS
jgi:hypothetical protein